jgi:hypothetical protein
MYDKVEQPARRLRKLFSKLSKGIKEGGLLNASQFSFCYNTVLHCMRLKDHMTLSFNNNMITY